MIQAIIKKLIDSGFDIWVSQGKIQFRQLGNNGLNQDWLNSLLSEIKNNKEEAVRCIQNDNLLENTLEKLYAEKLEDIASRYISGGLEYVEKYNKDLFAEIQTAKDNLNSVWDRCLTGEFPLSEYKKILDSWHSLQIDGIRMYKTNLFYNPHLNKPWASIEDCPGCRSYIRWPERNKKYCGYWIVELGEPKKTELSKIKMCPKIQKRKEKK